MGSHEAHEGPSPAGHQRRHRWLPIAGGGVAVAAILAHMGGGAVLMHLGLGGVLANLGAGGLALGLAAVVAIKLLVVFGVFGARRWLRGR